MSEKAYKLHLNVFYITLILFISLSINKLIEGVFEAYELVNTCYMVMYRRTEERSDEYWKE